MTKIKWTAFGLIATITVAIIYYNSGTTKTSELKKVQVAQFGDVFLYMPLYVAIDRGFFREEGLEIELTNTGGDDKTFAAVIGGSAIFGIADPTFVAIAKEQGQGGRVVASVVNGVPFWGVTKNNNIPLISEAKQLNGYSVATFPSPSTAFTLQSQMFRSAGLEPNIKQAAFGTLLPMLENGQADIALELEPNVSIAVHNGARVLYSLSDIYGDFAITGVMISDETAEQDPELVRKFVRALDKSEKFSHQYPDSVAFYARKRFTEINGETIKNAVSRIIENKTLPRSTFISAEAWNKAVQLRYDAGEIKSLETARTVLDMSFSSGKK